MPKGNGSKQGNNSPGEKSIFAMSIPEKWLDEVLKLAHKGQSEAEIVEALCNQHTLLFNERTGFYEYDTDAGI